MVLKSAAKLEPPPPTGKFQPPTTYLQSSKITTVSIYNPNNLLLQISKLHFIIYLQTPTIPITSRHISFSGHVPLPTYLFFELSSPPDSFLTTSHLAEILLQIHLRRQIKSLAQTVTVHVDGLRLQSQQHGDLFR